VNGVTATVAQRTYTAIIRLRPRTAIWRVTVTSTDAVANTATDTRTLT
jgi:hypothetical protein